MNIFNIKSARNISLALALTAMSSSAFSQEVDTDTPDAKLLEGIDKSQMYKVAKPSTRLEFFVEGLEYPIDVRYLKNATVLYVEDATVSEKDRILKAYKELTNTKQVIIKSKEELDNTDSE